MRCKQYKEYRITGKNNRRHMPETLITGIRNPKPQPPS